MPKFPVDAPQEKVIKAFELLGFRQVRIREHIAMERENVEGSSLSGSTFLRAKPPAFHC